MGVGRHSLDLFLFPLCGFQEQDSSPQAWQEEPAKDIVQSLLILFHVWSVSECVCVHARVHKRE